MLEIRSPSDNSGSEALYGQRKQNNGILIVKLFFLIIVYSLEAFICLQDTPNIWLQNIHGVMYTRNIE